MDTQLSKDIRLVWQEVHSPASLPFPKTVEKLQSLGAQRYHIDYVASTATAYVGQKVDVSEIPAHQSSEDINLGYRQGEGGN